jgi:hypothetical protein
MKHDQGVAFFKPTIRDQFKAQQFVKRDGFVAIADANALLVPIAFSVWFVRLSIQFWGALRMFLNPTLEPIAVIVLQSAGELARDEIKEAFGEILPDPIDTHKDDNP